MLISVTIKAVRKSLNILGLEIHRRSNVFGFGIESSNKRAALRGVLRQAKAVGLSPKTVIDVGAAYGEFSRLCHTFFPDARYLLIEPVAEYQSYLEATAKSIAKADYIPVAVAAEIGEVVMHIHPDLVGSSLFLEQEYGDVNGFPRAIQVTTLDSLIEAYKLEGPCLIKIDVQGAEMAVLQGAGEILKMTEYILLETSLFEFFKGGVLFHEIISFMQSKGFVVYDLCELQYRPLDNALAQADIAFVKENGLFRQHHAYATPRQREKQNKVFSLR